MLRSFRSSTENKFTNTTVSSVEFGPSGAVHLRHFPRQALLEHRTGLEPGPAQRGGSGLCKPSAPAEFCRLGGSADPASWRVNGRDCRGRRPYRRGTLSHLRAAVIQLARALPVHSPAKNGPGRHENPNRTVPRCQVRRRRRYRMGRARALVPRKRSKVLGIVQGQRRGTVLVDVP